MAKKNIPSQNPSGPSFFSKLLRWIIVLVVILILAYGGISYYIADVMTQPYHNITNTSPVFVAPTHEDISFRASDGVHLKGWLVKNPTTDRLIIMVAGVGANRANEPYFGVQIAHDLYEKGYSVMMYDARSEGESDLTRLDFGERTGNDVVGAVQFATSQGFKPEHTAVLADSLGAISTLMVIEKLNPVGAIILDSPASDVKPVIEGILQREKGVPSFLNTGIFFIAKALYGTDVNQIQPINHLLLVPDRKILYLHGQLDTTIPIENSIHLLHRSNPESKLVIFDHGNHVETYKSDPDLYRTSVFDWLDAELK